MGAQKCPACEATTPLPRHICHSAEPSQHTAQQRRRAQGAAVGKAPTSQKKASPHTRNQRLGSSCSRPTAVKNEISPISTPRAYVLPTGCGGHAAGQRQGQRGGGGARGGEGGGGGGSPPSPLPSPARRFGAEEREGRPGRKSRRSPAMMLHKYARRRAQPQQRKARMQRPPPPRSLPPRCERDCGMQEHAHSPTLRFSVFSRLNMGAARSFSGAYVCG